MVLNGAGLDVPSTRRIPSFSDLSTAAGGAGADLPSMASSASTNESPDAVGQVLMAVYSIQGPGRQAEHWRARSRRYRSRIMEVNTHLHTSVQISDLKFSIIEYELKFSA